MAIASVRKRGREVVPGDRATIQIVTRVCLSTMPPSNDSNLATHIDITNASIILALSKMGIYMERDKKNLAGLSPKEQNIRLQKAFDRAVENCCILPLLFSKSELAKGNISLVGKPVWKGWGPNKIPEMRRRTLQSPPESTMQAMVNTIGEICPMSPPHAITPCRG